MKKLRITSMTGHFGKVLGYDDRDTYDIPPISTIIGLLKVIYGENVLQNTFKFGYIYRDKGSFKDDIIIYKHRIGGGTFLKKGRVERDCRYIEYRDRCELLIYTDIDLPLKINYILNMGRTDNLATLELPIKEVELINKKGGKSYNVLTPKDLGKGKIFRCNMISIFNNELDSYDNKTELLRFNKELEFDRNYDVEEDQSIFMWKYKDGEVLPDVY